MPKTAPDGGFRSAAHDVSSAPKAPRRNSASSSGSSGCELDQSIRPRRSVRTGTPGDTVKQIVVFNPEDPIRLSQGRRSPPQTSPPPTSAEFPHSPSPPSPIPAAVAQGVSAASPAPPDPIRWTNCIEIAEADALRLPLFDLSEAGSFSCTKTFLLLNKLGRAWPHRFAVCHSRNTGVVWLLSQAGQVPNLQAALEAHDHFESVHNWAAKLA